MRYYIAVVVGVILFSLIAGMLLKKKNILTLPVIGISLYLCFYVLTSGMLCWIDQFGIFRSCLSSTFMGAIIYGILKIKKYVFSYSWPDKATLIPIAILLISVPLVWNQFDVYGMGQDEGVYQTKAIALISGDNHNQFDFDEYHDLSASEQEQYRQFVKIFAGFYKNASYPTFEENNQHCDVTGYFHGVPTMGAMLALGAALFGIASMKRISLIMFLATVWLIFAFCEERKWSKITAFLLTIITAVSPIVIWVTKSSLTESFLTLAITLTLFLITATIDHPGIGRGLIAVPIAAFCFFHVSAFMLMPGFTAVLLLLYLEKRDRQYLFIHYSILIAFAMGFYMMLITAPQYTYDNLKRMEIGPLNHNNLWIVPILYAAAAILLSFIISRIRGLTLKTIAENAAAKWLIRALIMFSLIYVAYFVWKMHLALPQDELQVNKGLRDFYWGNKNLYTIFQYTPFFAVCIFSGILLVPAVIISAWKSPEWYLELKNVSVFVLFFYLVFLCNVFVRKEIPYYYYYARYLEYVIPVVVLMTGILMEKINVKFAMVLSFIGIAVMIPYSLFLAKNDDDSVIQTNTLMSICDSIKPGSAVIFDSSDWLIRNIGIDVRELSQVHIYPKFRDYDKELKELSTQYSRVYIITDRIQPASTGVVYREGYVEREYQSQSKSDLIPLISAVEEKKGIISIYDAKQVQYGMEYTEMMSYMNDVSYDSVTDTYAIGQGGILYGPYIDLTAGKYQLTVDIDHCESGSYSFQINSEQGKNHIAETSLQEGINKVDFELTDNKKEVEFAIHNMDTGEIKVSGIYLNTLK